MRNVRAWLQLKCGESSIFISVNCFCTRAQNDPHVAFPFFFVVIIVRKQLLSLAVAMLMRLKKNAKHKKDNLCGVKLALE